MKKLALLFSIFVLASGTCLAQTSGFTYQGKLADTGSPANGIYQFECKLFDAATVGIQAGSTQTVVATVTNGVFTTRLDFGAAAFPAGQDRWLEIGVRPNTSLDPYTVLSPRQQVNSVPFAVRSLQATNANNADNATSLAGVAASNYVQTSDTRLSDARTPTVGSANYIQNTTTPQASSNFNVSGNGTAGGTLSANIVNAATQFNIGGSRVLSNSGFENLFAGVGAGQSNTGDGNSFVGRNAGQTNTTGRSNSFFGVVAGQTNTTGSFNAFFGSGAGFNNNASENAFFGYAAGGINTSGSVNAFFGKQAGELNTEGGGNSFFGKSAGQANTTGIFNTSIGFFANVGSGNLSNATAIGANAVVSQSNSLVLGNNANVGIGTTAPTERFHVVGNGLFTGNLMVNATVNANVFSAETQFTLGGNRILSNPGVSNLFVGVHAGFANTTGSGNAFFGFNSGLANNDGGANSFFGFGSGFSNTTGNLNSFFGASSGSANSDGIGNNFVGFQAGANNTSGSNNTFIGANSGPSNTLENNNTFIGNNANGAAGITNATAIGILASVTQSNSLVLGGINTVNGATADTNVGIGTTAPTEKLQVAGGNIRWSNSILQNSQGGSIELGGTNAIAGSGIPFIDFHFSGLTEDYNVRLINDATGQLSVFGNLNVTGKVQVAVLGAAGGTALCLNGSNQISSCSSSLRYKTNIKPFSYGLNFISRLRPIAFSWKDGGMKDVGFGAEDVAKISPLLVTYNAKGEVEGVKYDRLSVLFVNAIKEQQTQMAGQQKLIEKQQQQIDLLKQELCRSNPDAAICKSN